MSFDPLLASDLRLYEPVVFQGLGTCVQRSGSYRFIGNAIEGRLRITSGTAPWMDVQIALPTAMKTFRGYPPGRTLVGHLFNNTTKECFLLVADPGESFLSVKKITDDGVENVKGCNIARCGDDLIAEFFVMVGGSS